MAKNKKTTIQDLANYANVSIGTIDRVLHNRGKVSPAKRQKVEEAIEKLDFNPNLLARTLALGSRFTVCSLFPEATSSQSYWALPKIGVDQGVEVYKDFGMELHAYEYSLFDESSFVKSADAILGKNPSGVILAPLFEKESLEFISKLEERHIPYVFIDANIKNKNSLSYIGPDLRGSGYIAGKLLNSLLGPSDDILIVNMVKGFENSAHTALVENGFRDYFKERGSWEKRSINSITIPTTAETEVNRELTTYYIKNPGTKGVFVTNSRAHLISRYHAMHELDIKVVGFDIVPGNVAELKNGNIDYIISQRPVFQGVTAVRNLFEFFVYQKSPSGIQYVPLDIIIKENVDYYIKFQ
ncbi:LacI family DNA-binding transcriptional regulator [Arenibacter sp. F20364]|uniref:LacI family DNA-binding transcriptional regulator n=1 Tax=Arenibacter sp. F20364 TaxID=2926415 RepID=UPI001FF0F020|nr:LacI family DNA-binding transcriptional regulator [Arenibacter sp. F20364]MCK0191357.1 LacI family DNA-binding transcriptional regulator [Arenibacter sp. F20364]